MEDGRKLYSEAERFDICAFWTGSVGFGVFFYFTAHCIVKDEVLIAL